MKIKQSCAIAGMVFLGCCGITLAARAQTRVAEAAQETSSNAGALPKLQPVSGPYGVGRVGYHWTDPKRPDRHSTAAQARRELMVYLWYPAPQPHARFKGAYFPGAKQMDSVPELQRRMREEFGFNWPSIVSGTVSSHAMEAAKVVKSPRQFPTVVFSHGNGSTCFSYTTLIEDLASRGYVVAAIEHTQSAIAVLFPDGRIVPFRSEVIPPGLSPAERSQRRMASISATIEEGAADVRFVLDRLAELNAIDAQHFLLAGRLDLNRVAAMGHSAGAEFAARACQLDPRFKACVDLDGGMVPISALPVYPDGATMKQPLLFLEADHPESQMGGTPAQHQEYFRKKEEQLRSCPQGSYNVILKSPGIAHPSFSDIPLFFAGRQGYPEIDLVLHNHDLIKTFVRAFMDKNIRGQKAPLLDDSTRPHPEATVHPLGR
jgi:dienelactone hydrolase